MNDYTYKLLGFFMVILVFLFSTEYECVFIVCCTDASYCTFFSCFITIFNTLLNKLDAFSKIKII